MQPLARGNCAGGRAATTSRWSPPVGQGLPRRGRSDHACEQHRSPVLDSGPRPRGDCSADLAPRQADQVLVRTLYTAISRGTEALVFRGEVPPSQHGSMRAPFQEGDFPGPIKYGYIASGKCRKTR